MTYTRVVGHDEGPRTKSADREAVRSILERGGSHSSKEIARQLGTTNLSTFRLEIRRITLDLALYDNVPIVADREGYRIAKTADDVDEYVDWLTRYRESIDFRIKAVQSAWSKQSRSKRGSRRRKKD